MLQPMPIKFFVFWFASNKLRHFFMDCFASLGFAPVEIKDFYVAMVRTSHACASSSLPPACYAHLCPRFAQALQVCLSFDSLGFAPEGLTSHVTIERFQAVRQGDTALPSRLSHPLRPSPSFVKPSLARLTRLRLTNITGYSGFCCRVWA